MAIVKTTHNVQNVYPTQTSNVNQTIGQDYQIGDVLTETFVHITLLFENPVDFTNLKRGGFARILRAASIELNGNDRSSAMTGEEIAMMYFIEEGREAVYQVATRQIDISLPIKHILVGRSNPFLTALDLRRRLDAAGVPKELQARIELKFGDLSDIYSVVPADANITSIVTRIRTQGVRNMNTDKSYPVRDFRTYRFPIEGVGERTLKVPRRGKTRIGRIILEGDVDGVRQVLITGNLRYVVDDEIRYEDDMRFMYETESARLDAEFPRDGLIVMDPNLFNLTDTFEVSDNLESDPEIEFTLRDIAGNRTMLMTVEYIRNLKE